MNLFNAEILEIFWQLTLAVLLGAVIGFERELARKTAGMRTFALVSLGAALFAVISGQAFKELWGTQGFDPSRIASQVVVGIGFIGAGLIIFRKSKLRGLTTAAGLWVSAAIGVAVGYRLYSIAIFSTILTLLVFWLLWAIENKLVKTISPRAFSEFGDEDGDDNEEEDA